MTCWKEARGTTLVVERATRNNLDENILYYLFRTEKNNFKTQSFFF